MSGFLRFLGLFNAAIWFGGSLFFTLGVAPAIFSDEMRQLFAPSSSLYFAGGIAMVVLKRYLALQYVCCGIALVHLLAEKLYLGNSWPRLTLGVATGVLALGLIGGIWLQPRMAALRHEKYFDPSPAQRESAGHAFGVWHGISQSVNLLMLGGVLIYLIRMTRPAETRRRGTYYQIP